MMPTHVVIDTIDGWTWTKDHDGFPFTKETATVFMNELNSERVAERQTIIIAAVVPVKEEEKDA